MPERVGGIGYVQDFVYHKGDIFMKKIAIVLVSLLFVACSSTPKSTSPEKTANKPPAITKSEAVVSSTTETNVSVPSAETEANKLAAELQELPNKSVFFDFDKSVIKPQYQDVIQMQAEFIKAHKNDIVTVEGNCDERGSTEYNLALGDRRAKAARKNLELLGVPATQIRTVSLGEERARLLCHEENCWKENRRDDFVHKLD